MLQAIKNWHAALYQSDTNQMGVPQDMVGDD
jgi:hypothetical protein